MNLTFFVALFLSTLQVNNSNSATAALSRNLSIQDVCQGATKQFQALTSGPCTNPRTRLFTPEHKSVPDSSNSRFTKNDSGIYLHDVNKQDEGRYIMHTSCIERKYTVDIFLRVVCENLWVYEGAREVKFQFPSPQKIDIAQREVLLNESRLDIFLPNKRRSIRAVSNGNITNDGIKNFGRRLKLDPKSNTPVLFGIRKSDEGKYTYMRWWLIDGVQRIPSPFTFFLEVLDPTVLPTTGSPTTSRSLDAGTTRQITPTEGGSANASYHTKGPLSSGQRITASMSCFIVCFFAALVAIYTG